MESTPGPISQAEWVKGRWGSEPDRATGNNFNPSWSLPLELQNCEPSPSLEGSELLGLGLGQGPGIYFPLGDSIA